MRGELTFAPTYNDDFVGWPLRPKDRTHGVNGTFLNPTTRWPAGMGPPNTGYHKAIDILISAAAKALALGSPS